MKLQLYKNIDVVQIDIKQGVSEYFLPQNVDWAEQKIDKIVVYGVDMASPEEVSPIDGINPLISQELLSSAYLDLYNKDGAQIGYAISANNIKHTCNYPIEINSKISLQTSKLVFTQTPEQDYCLLMYVFWNTAVVETDDLPNHSVTVYFPIGYGEEICLANVIDTYIHSQSKKVKGMYFWSLPNRTIFITLRDYNYKTIVKLLPGAMCRPPMGVPEYAQGESTVVQSQLIQTETMYLDCEDVDFENSFVFNSDFRVNPTRKNTVTITFLY